MKRLTIFLDGGGSLYRAHCPELDITNYGPTEKIALDNLFVLAKAEAQGILKGKGKKTAAEEDERIECAKLVCQTEDVEPLFEIVHGPCPTQRSGLK